MNALCDSLEWAPFIAYGLIKNLSPYLTGMETNWRPVGDSSLRGSWSHRRDVSWRFGGSRGSRGEIKHVRFFLQHFEDFFKSPVGLGDVEATSQRLNMFSWRKTSPQRLRDLLETKWLRKKLRRRLRNVSATSRRRLRDTEATSPRRRLTYFYRPRREIIKKAKTYIYL